MKLKQTIVTVLVGSAILSLAACSSTKHGSPADGSLAENDVQTNGIGDNGSFNDGASSGRHGLANNRTYYFDYDRSNVHDSDKPSIYSNAERLASNPHQKATIEGHTDPRGSREYNVALAERRANAVADLMKSKGVSSNQLHVVSYGAERLARPGHTEEDYQLDRRAILD